MWQLIKRPLGLTTFFIIYGIISKSSVQSSSSCNRGLNRIANLSLDRNRGPHSWFKPKHTILVRFKSKLCPSLLGNILRVICLSKFFFILRNNFSLDFTKWGNLSESWIFVFVGQKLMKTESKFYMFVLHKVKRKNDFNYHIVLNLL